ncbi:GAF domain-containing protein [Nocardia sp. NPDC049526]|uniref:GAF domain-containing protein n=1 Tax=Nocardia sp. NPDC049526 TaxID=3364316 RepID=UPI0037B090EF
MIIERWLLIETLGRVDSWSVLAIGTTPREWKSFQRAVPSRLQPLVAAACASGSVVDQVLPPSRQVWSGRRLRAVPISGPDERVYAIHLWVGPGDPPPAPGVAPFLVDARTRRVDALMQGLGPDFAPYRTRWVGAEIFEMVERFDGELDFVANLTRSEPDSRWLGTATVQSKAGPRSILVATRNADTPGDRHRWRGLAVDVTDSVAPQRKSFEATALDMLRRAQPNLYLAIVDTAQIRLIRWVTEPVPTMRWAGTDERTVPHPADRARIIEARNAMRSGAAHHQLRAVRLAGENNDWIIADLEISPLPGATSNSSSPEFVLVQLEIVENPGLA